jgi:hypothetical protein
MYDLDSMDSADREMAGIPVCSGDPLVSAAQLGFPSVAPAWEPPRGFSSSCSGVRVKRATNPMPVLEREWSRFSPISPGIVPDSVEPRSVGNGVKGFSPFRRDASGESNSGSFRLAATGVALMVFRCVYRKGDLLMGEEDLERLILSHKELQESRQAVPIVLVTMQALASTPTARQAFARWARKENKLFVCSARREVGLDHGVCPWETQGMWTFATWALAAQLVAKFVGQLQPPVEPVFVTGLGDLCRITETEPWILELMLVTLFLLKDTAWIWPILF